MLSSRIGHVHGELKEQIRQEVSKHIGKPIPFLKEDSKTTDMECKLHHMAEEVGKMGVIFLRKFLSRTRDLPSLSDGMFWDFICEAPEIKISI